MQIRLLTHETIIHAQLMSLERLLARELNCEITLNIKGMKSHIQIEASEDEIIRIKHNLGYTVYVLESGEWTASA